uniref:Uncharacterized protein n=1 Tax=Rhizophora mucronata TaxID=61149 RepID=A0A2P2QQL1_RHIMU
MITSSFCSARHSLLKNGCK